MANVGHLDTKARGLFGIIFIMAMVRNLDAMLGGYFELSLIMSNVGNLDVNLDQISSFGYSLRPRTFRLLSSLLDLMM